MIGVFFIFDINYNMIYSFLNEIINLVLSNKSKWNELDKYDCDEDLTNYDFFNDEKNLIKNNKIPKYNSLLNTYTIQKIKENYKDDFI